jgi:hypothetical protein
LTLQFENGYIKFDVGVADEGTLFAVTAADEANLTNLEKNGGKLSKLWKKMRNNAFSKLQMIPFIKIAKLNSFVL